MKPTRLLTRGLAIAALIALALAISPGIAQPGAAPVIRPLAAPIRVEATIPIQGRLTDAGGHPVPDADYTVTFYVRDGTGVICTVPPTAVHTEKGLFNAYLTGCSTSIFDGRFLTLGIQVGADPEMTPVQVIYPVPYAMSLRPGATIANNDTGHALTVKSSTSGGGNSALWAENTDASGIGIWSKAVGNDASVVIENLGTGALLKGFGAGGGEDEITITNEGKLQVKPDTTISIPGLTAVLEDGTTNATLFPQSNGGVRVTPNGIGGVSTILIGIPLPTTLYGQQVDVESLSIFYRTTNPRSFITYSALLDGSYPGGGVGNIAWDYTDYGSVTYAQITLAPLSHYNLFSSMVLFVEVTMDFGEDYDSIYILGLSLRVGHHPSY